MTRFMLANDARLCRGKIDREMPGIDTSQYKYWNANGETGNRVKPREVLTFFLYSY